MSAVKSRERLIRGGLDPGYVERVARAALDEDLSGGVDVTSVATVPAERIGTGELAARAGGVVAGLPVAAVVFEVAADGAAEVSYAVDDGSRVRPGDTLMTVRGPVRALLTAERSALNLACHLSGVATATRRWVDALTGTKVAVLDTRKTTPGLRPLEKYAVRCGGGENKRMGLSDVAMIKDNHVVAAGGIGQAFAAVRRTFPDVPVQVECDTVEQAREAIEVGADFLLCDNMPPQMLREVVIAARGRARVEATGGLTLDRARAYAETGVDFVSVGALTHSAPILDVALDLRGPGGG